MGSRADQQQQSCCRPERAHSAAKQRACGRKGGHTAEERTYRDTARTHWLETNGCRVIRFWNIDIFQRPSEVTEAIYQALTTGVAKK